MLAVNQFKVANPVSERTLSSFPLSVGTGLAFESLFSANAPVIDPDRKVPHPPSISKYGELWINLWTLWRNIASALTKEQLIQATAIDFKEVMEQEISVILSLCDESINHCKPVFYLCTYNGVYKKNWPNAIVLRKDNTDGQKHLSALFQKTMALFSKEHKGSFLELDDDLPGSRNDAVLLSHVPWDLLSARRFKTLHLLESHTGKIKTRHQWHSKYHGISGQKLEDLPFNRRLLLIFGDSVMFTPMDIRLRRQILEIAERRKWTGLTQEDTVMMHLSSDIKEPYVLSLIRSL